MTMLRGAWRWLWWGGGPGARPVRVYYAAGRAPAARAATGPAPSARAAAGRDPAARPHTSRTVAG